MTAIATMMAQQLGLPAVNLHKTGPLISQLWMGGGPIKLDSIFLRGRFPLLHPFAFSVISRYWEKGIIIFSCVSIDAPRCSRWFKTHGYAESPGKVSTLKTKTKMPEHEKRSCKVGRLAAVGEK